MKKGSGLLREGKGTPRYTPTSALLRTQNIPICGAKRRCELHGKHSKPLGTISPGLPSGEAWGMGLHFLLRKLCLWRLRGNLVP